MPPLEGVVPTLTPQGVGKGDRPKWHGHRAGEKGGIGALANIMEHTGGRRGKPAVSLSVGAGPGVWVRLSVLTGCGLTLGLGAFGWGGGSCTRPNPLLLYVSFGRCTQSVVVWPVQG